MDAICADGAVARGRGGGAIDPTAEVLGAGAGPAPAAVADAEGVLLIVVVVMHASFETGARVPGTNLDQDGGDSHAVGRKRTETPGVHPAMCPPTVRRHRSPRDHTDLAPLGHTRRHWWPR